LVLDALRDIVNTFNVGLAERLAEMREHQVGRVHCKCNLSWALPVVSPADCILGVLQKFEDEVRAVAIKPGGQLTRFLSIFSIVAMPVLLANYLVVRRHGLFLMVRHRFGYQFSEK
jgi:hypothetical protein